MPLHTHTTPPHIDLARRFRDLTSAELEAPEHLAALNESPTLGATYDWDQLLARPRVVILAEAGTGKTVEMELQAARCEHCGKRAFFVALEELYRNRLENILKPGEAQALEAWKLDSRAKAWFFLDSVDELKLVSGKLRSALVQLAHTLDGHLDRAHIIVSSRPTDWRLIDREALETLLPVKAPAPQDEPDAEDRFLARLRDSQSGRRGAPLAQPVISETLSIVQLLPLSNPQIVRLAQNYGIDDSTAFLAEIRRHDAWAFARRPLDLEELASHWQLHKSLGTRARQHEANITTKLSDHPDRQDHGVLSERQAREGAERLALALALTRMRTFRSSEQALAADDCKTALDPAVILRDWTAEQRQTLLRRPLFDPATYGRVRFHHRSVEAYLAACRLHALEQKGMAKAQIRRLLFGKQYGSPVVIPSMREIAAWLAIWNEDVLRELMQREPETLVSLGDPEELPPPIRAKILSEFAAQHGSGLVRGLDLSLDGVRRLAHPELADVVRKLWSARRNNPEMTLLLLDIIWQGRLESCADQAYEAARDVDLPEGLREVAIRALDACADTHRLRKIGVSMLRPAAPWTSHIVQSALPYLFPNLLSVRELLTLLRRAAKQDDLPGFAWPLAQIVDGLAPSAPHTAELRDGLTRSLLRGRGKNPSMGHQNSTFSPLAPALAQLCDRRLATQGTNAFDEPELIWASVVAHRFIDPRGDSAEVRTSLRTRFSANPHARERAFWRELEITASVEAASAAQKVLVALYDSLLGNEILTTDAPWLLDTVRSSPHPKRRPLALHAWLRLWRRRAAAAACKRQFLEDRSCPLALTWLKGFFLFAPDDALDALEEDLATRPDSDRSDRAFDAFAILFGHGATATSRARTEHQSPRLLGRLLRLAQSYFPLRSERRQPGSFILDSRDHAEMARGLLLNRLLELPGAEAHATIQALAAEPTFASFADLLRHRARLRAALDSEPPPWSPADVEEMEATHELPPQNRDSLHRFVLDRLDDFKEHVANDDFSPRKDLQELSREASVQRYLAEYLDQNARGAYKVLREVEVADQKRPDLCLLARRGDQQVAIEMKIADNYSLADLEEVLSEQLVGKYLRIEARRAGCLLLIRTGKRLAWLAQGRRLNFTELIAHLEQRAAALTEHRASEICLAVVGVDLTIGRPPSTCTKAKRSSRRGTKAQARPSF